MDFLIISSNYSKSCKELINTFPTIKDKVIIADYMDIRNICEQLNIVSVPTLLVISEGKILTKIEGSERIKHWLFMTVFNVEELTEQEHPQKEEIQSPPQIINEFEDILPVVHQEEPIEEDMGIKKSKKNMDARIIAEELQKERDTFINAMSKNPSNNLQIT